MAEAGSSPSRPATVEDVEEVQELQEGDFTVEVVQAAGEEEEGVVVAQLHPHLLPHGSGLAAGPRSGSDYLVA